MKNQLHKIFITGGTGYVGRHLIPKLLKRGHDIYVLTRQNSVHKVPSGCHIIVGNALDKSTYQEKIASADTFIHLIGTPHPSPLKGEVFQKVDLLSIQEAVPAAVKAGIKHFIYISVAHPAPVMKTYIQVRIKGETLIRESRLNATILRPWYILGPGRRWPYIFSPVYWMLKRFPSTKEFAQRLGFISLKEMINALAVSIENPPTGVRILEVPQIQSSKT
jgi:nucleoside-diphosphate-sugar epimerase